MIQGLVLFGLGVGFAYALDHYMYRRAVRVHHQRMRVLHGGPRR